MMFTIQMNPVLPREAMADTLEIIKLDLVSQYEQSGEIDIGEWVRRHPAHRDELIDFWMWLKGTRSSPDESLESEPLDPSDIAVFEQSLNDACLAVTFGGEWLKPAVDPETPQLERLGNELEILRRMPTQARNPRNAFRKAVVCTWVVYRLQQTRPRVTRLAVQKVTYLLEQAMSLGVFVEHDRKPLGPYDRNARYKDAEPIAKKKGWLEIRGTMLAATEDLSGLTRFLRGYVRSEKLAGQLVDSLAGLSDDQLETLATVHWVARELEGADQPATIESVIKTLGETEEWKAKLSRPNFKRSSIQASLSFLAQLQLVG